MIRELVEFVFLRRWSRHLAARLRALRYWQSNPQGLNKASPGHSDAILRNAALLSVTLHLVALLVLPTPGASGEPVARPRIVLDGSLLAPEPMQTPTPPEPEPFPVAEDPAEEPDPQTDPVPDNKDSDVEPIVLEDKFTTNSVDLAPDPAEQSREEALQAERIRALLEQTQKTAHHNQDRERWLMMEVRERILNNLSRLLKTNATIHQEDDTASFLVGFLIDSEGWIYDISLLPAPGVEFDAFAVRDAIAILNPLNPPPTGIAIPIELELRVDFLERR